MKNKAPAAVQITAEQLLREAHERQEQDTKPPRQKITDSEELQNYRCGACPPPPPFPAYARPANALQGESSLQQGEAQGL